MNYADRLKQTAKRWAARTALGRRIKKFVRSGVGNGLGENLKFLAEEETSIEFRGDFTTTPLTQKLLQAFLDAMAIRTKLPDWIRTMPGMSGRKYRYLINNLVGSLEDARYLEVGSWTGSTACSTIHGNKVVAVCIDNWSEFGGPKDAFQTNIKRALTPGVKFSFIEKDFRGVDFAALGKFNVYMFDGPHEERDQYDGVERAFPALDDEFILIVDDYNHQKVVKGTQSALQRLPLTTVASIEIKTSQLGRHPQIAFQYSDWHDGYLLSVCRKTE
jgi:hypothetical protein